MAKSTKPKKWLPAAFVALAALILAGEYFTGPFVSFSILFVVPVALAARFSGRWWGVSLGILMPLAHLCFTFPWSVPWSFADSLFNAMLRMAVLVTFAVLIDHVTRQAVEIRVLEGLLPICAFCKRIRTSEQKWQQIESYIVEHSEASFTHGFCPDCMKQHYGEFYDKILAAKALRGAPQSASSGPAVQ
jgi:hypothetical protein